MVKKSSTSKSPSKIDTNRTAKTKNVISKDHPLELVIHEKRTRVPTERSLQAIAFVVLRRPTKRSSSKKGSSKGRSSSKGNKDSKDSKDKGKSSPRSRSPSKGSTKSRGTSSTSSKGEKGTKKSQSRSRPKTSAGSKGADTKKGTSNSRSRSKSKTALKRTRTMAQTIKESKDVLKSIDKATTNKPDRETIKNRRLATAEVRSRSKGSSKSKEKKSSKGAKGSVDKKDDKKGMKRTRTIKDAIASSKQLTKGVRGRTRSTDKKKK